MPFPIVPARAFYAPLQGLSPINRLGEGLRQMNRQYYVRHFAAGKVYAYWVLMRRGFAEGIIGGE